jgi:acetyl esterase/lipase
LPGPGGEIRFRRYRPLGTTAGLLPTLIYYHGGGFVIGNIETDSTCRRLANKSRCQVISIDYRLSPEHPFPAPLDDGIAAFRHIRTRPRPSRSIVNASQSVAIRQAAPSRPWSARPAAMPANKCPLSRC